MSKISKEILERVSFNADKRKSNADIRRFSDETIRDHPRVPNITIQRSITSGSRRDTKTKTPFGIICENLRSKRVFQNAALTKQQIRSKILLELKTQKEEERNQKSRLIKEKLCKTRVFKKAKMVMFYIALSGEVNTDEMIEEARSSGKLVAVPVCKKNRITLKPCILDGQTKLKKGPYGICQPQLEKPVHLKDIDLVIVPGLAFDKKGNRLGRGKGCYDRFLNRLAKDIPSIGLAFDFQILPTIPATSDDVKVQRVLFA